MKNLISILTVVTLISLTACSQIKSYFPDKELTEGFKNSSVRRFILELGFNEVLISMQSACSRMNYSSDSTKYFCGICWSKIKN